MRTTVFAFVFAWCLLVVPPAESKEEQELANEAEISTTIELEQHATAAICNARAALEWYQKGDSIHVESSLENDSCSASSGSFIVQVKYRPDDGEAETKEFKETWSRTDNAPQTMAKDYFIAANIDVTSVRIKKLRCKCAQQE